MNATTFAAVLVKEIRALTRDVHGLVVLFLMPAAFILVMSLALRDVFAVGESRTLQIVLVQLDQSKATDDLVAVLPPALERVDSREAAVAALRARQAELAVIIPAGYEAGLLDTQTTRPLVEIVAEPTVRPEVMRIVGARVATAVLRQRIAAQITAITGGAANPPSAGDMAGSTEMGTVSASYLSSVGGKSLTATQQNVPAWLVFGMFFVVTPICDLLITERTLGTLAPLRTMLVPISIVIVGKLVPYYLINMLQAVLMLVVGRFDAIAPFALLLTGMGIAFGTIAVLVIARGQR